MNMDTTLIIYLLWLIIIMLILRKTDNAKIKEMGVFCEKVLPKIPISKIIEILWKK